MKEVIKKLFENASTWKGGKKNINDANGRINTTNVN